MNKELKEAIIMFKNLDMGNDKEFKKARNKILKELKRLQEENNRLVRANKTYINSIQSITPVLLEDYIEKDKIREILDKLNISDIEPWSIYKVKGEILFDLEKLLKGK